MKIVYNLIYNNALKIGSVHYFFRPIKNNGLLKNFFFFSVKNKYVY